MPRTAPCYSSENYYEFFNISYKNKAVLDIGSSVGSFKKSGKFKESAETLKESKEYISIDIDPNSGADIIADAHELPFKDDCFDIIIANNVIEHFYDPTKAVSEMKRVLKKNGQLYFTIPFMHPVHEAPHDYSRLTRYGLEKLFNDFKSVEIYARGGVISAIANFEFIATKTLDVIKIGELVRMMLYPVLLISVQFDRFDKTEAFPRAYFGRMKK